MPVSDLYHTTERGQVDELGPLDFFTETDRLAIVQQLRMREAASRNIAEYYRAMLEVLKSRSGDLDNRRIEELEKGIAAAEREAEKWARQISSWERPR